MKILTPVILTALALSFVPALTASKAAPAPAFSAAQAGSYTIDGAHSSVNFRIKHLDVSATYGRFDSVTGNFVLSEEAGKSELKAGVAARSVNTNNEKRDQHLSGPDFLNVKQFPNIVFESSAFKKTGETTYEVTGTLDFHGVKKEVTVPMTLLGARDAGEPFGFRAGLEGSLKINRRDFGMETYPNDVVGNEVTLTLAFEGIKE